jgi:hypothetical protein
VEDVLPALFPSQFSVISTNAPPSEGTPGSLKTRRDGRIVASWRAIQEYISKQQLLVQGVPPQERRVPQKETTANMVKHHLMIGTWTPPGVIITVAFDDETLKLELVKKTEIPEDEPISWMAFDVCAQLPNPDATKNG